MATDQHQHLIDAATEARQRAYVPYSDFKMGAAVEASDGSVVTGVLVENVSLGLAMCAERVALFRCATEQLDPVRVVLVAERTDDELTYPCGACLQVALELGGSDVEVIVSDPDGATEQTTVGDLLPRGPHKG